MEAEIAHGELQYAKIEDITQNDSVENDGNNMIKLKKIPIELYRKNKLYLLLLCD